MPVERGDLQESGQFAEKLAGHDDSETDTWAPDNTAQDRDELSAKKL